MSDKIYYEKKEFDIDFPVQVFYEHRNRPSLYYGSHWHEEIELTYVAEGSAIIRLEQQEYSLSKGDLLIINGNSLHEAKCISTPYTCKVIAFRTADMMEKFAIQNILFTPLIHQDPQIDYYMERIFDECEEQRIAYKDSCKAYITLLLAYLSRYYMTDALSDTEAIRRKNQLLRFNEVLLFIENNYSYPITNQQLADIMYMSVGHFANLFNKTIGMAPQKYINAMRLDKAKELLLSKKYSVSQVASLVGFQDYNNFGRQFKKHFFCTPQEMLKQNVMSKDIH